MPTTSAYSVVSAVLPDWPGGSPPAFAEPTAASSFDAILQPRLAGASTVCEGGACYAPPEESPAQGDQSSAQGIPEASDDPPVDETARSYEEPSDDEVAAEVAQSLSGAAAVVNRAVLEAGADSSAENDAPNAETTPAHATDGDASTAAAASFLDTEAELLVASHSDIATAETGPKLAVQIAGENAITAAIHQSDIAEAQTEELDAEDLKAELPPEDRARQREGSQRLARNLNAEAKQSPPEIVPTPVESSEVRPDAQSQPIADQQGPSAAAPVSPTIGAAAAEPARSRPSDAGVAAEAGSAASRGSVEIDSARLLLRVARAFAQAADGRGEVTIRLNPPELGSLRLEVRMHEGALAARLQTETAEARTAILDNLPVLRERLADQGVRIERFDVDLMNRQPGDSPQQPFGEQRETPRALRAAAALRTSTNPPAAIPTTRASLADPGRLNVIV